jgi:hypothetical protein
MQYVLRDVADLIGKVNLVLCDEHNWLAPDGDDEVWNSHFSRQYISDVLCNTANELSEVTTRCLHMARAIDNERARHECAEFDLKEEIDKLKKELDTAKALLRGESNDE